MDVKELFTSQSLFSGLSQPALYRLAELAQLHTYRASETIIQEAHPALGCYIILSGRVQVIKSFNTPRSRVIAELLAGEIVGEMSVIDDQPHSASVVAIEETQCLMIERWDFKAQMQAYPEIALQLLPVLARRLRELLELTESGK